MSISQSKKPGPIKWKEQDLKSRLGYESPTTWTSLKSVKNSWFSLWLLWVNQHILVGFFTERPTLHFRKRRCPWGGSCTQVTGHGTLRVHWHVWVWLKTGRIYHNLLLSFWISIHLYSEENKSVHPVTVFSLFSTCLPCFSRFSIHFHRIMQVLRCQYFEWIKEDQRHFKFILKGFHLLPYHYMKLKPALFSAFPSW